jgi:hypothetical protein
MAYNLARNSRVFVTTNLNTATGAVLTTGLSTTNTWEVQVLDGFKFAQATNSANIQIKEGGNTPIRGQRAFNTALNPVDITFSTYMRPRLSGGLVTAEERVLWNALMGAVGIDGTVQNGTAVAGVTVTGTTLTALTRSSTTSSVVTMAGATITATGLALNEVVSITGMTGTGASYWNQPAKVTSIAAGAIVFTYITAPDAAAGTTSAGVPASGQIILKRGAWVEYPTATGVPTSYAQLTSGTSNKNQMQPIGFIFIVDSTAYTVDNCAIDQAQIDFGLDAIATIAWTIKGTKLNQIAMPVLSATADPVFSGSLTGTATGKITTANYITNKLSTVSLQSNLGGIGGTVYAVVITGGSMTIANNVTYVTPANIGVLNTPIGYFTGTRAISGNVTAYLKSGSGSHTGTLLNDILVSSATNTDTKYHMQIEVGGATAGTRVELEMDGAMLGIPSVDIADVVSTSITFTAQAAQSDIGAANAQYDIENTNELLVRYYSL